MRVREGLRYAAAAVLALHGLVHLLGTASYLELATIEGIPYETTLFGGRLEVGDAGIRLFGALWAVAAAGFVASAIGLAADRNSWRPLVLVVTLVSLCLTVAAWTVASAGIVVNLGILGGLWLTARR